MTRYGLDLGCRYRGVPHNLTIVHENPRVKWEKCLLCNRSFRWNKGYKKRVDNVNYLKAHVRNFAQRTGVTKRVYMKMYQPEKTKIVI